MPDTEKSLETANIASFRSVLLLACESALKSYKKQPTRESYLAAKGNLDGIFLGVMGTAHSIQGDFWRSDLMRVAHEIVNNHKSMLNQLFSSSAQGKAHAENS